MTGNVYCITNNINGKKYVGKTLSSLEERMREHISDAKKPHRENRPLYHAMNKYGFDNFTYEILVKDIDDINVLNELEIYYIKKFNC
jgi:group I intron endonuclease